MSGRTNNERIALYRSRKLGEKINDAVDFMKQNRRLLTRLAVYILLPVAIVQSIAVYGISNMVDKDLSEYWRSVLTYMTMAMLSGVFVITVAVTLVMAYREHGPEWLREAGFRDVWRLLWRNFRRTLLSLLLDMVLLLPVTLVMLIVLVIPIVNFVFPAAFALMIGFLLMLPLVYTLDLAPSINALSAVRKTWRLGWAQWGRLMGLMIVVFIIMTIVQGVVDLPFYVLFAVKETLINDHSQAGNLGSSILYNVIFFLVTVIRTFYAAVAEVLGTLILVYHYGSVADVEEDASLSADIANFENL